jgi:Rrf2 family protein
MRLSTRLRYGARAMVELARLQGGGPVSVGLLARRQGLSAKYLEGLMRSLQAVGLVRSLRGPQGGYVLARPAAQITLRDLYAALEGGEGLVPCTSDPNHCPRAASCAMQEVWASFEREMLKYLESITLAQLVERAAALERSQSLDYVI